MRRPTARSQRDQGGFTLVELLAVIGILGVIAFPLTEAFIVGLKTTDANANNMARSAAVQALQSYFTRDVHSAKLVSRLDPPGVDPPPAVPPPGCAPVEAQPDVFLHLSWSDQGKARQVSYSLESDAPPVEGQRELIRWSCTGGATTADRRMLGRLTFEPGGPLPVVAECQPPKGSFGPCPATEAEFDAITLKVLTPKPVDLTVRRRTE